MYKSVLTAFNRAPSSQLLLWTARALFDSKDYPAAKRMLLRAVHVCPHDPALLFDAALVMQENSTTVCASAAGRCPLRDCTAIFVGATQRLQVEHGVSCGSSFRLVLPLRNVLEAHASALAQRVDVPGCSQADCSLLGSRLGSHAMQARS
jgi:hypothetical protein